VAFQEKILGRLSFSFFSKLAEDEAHIGTAKESTKEAIEDEIDETFQS
jgi:hypothetical protein